MGDLITALVGFQSLPNASMKLSVEWTDSLQNGKKLPAMFCAWEINF